MILIELLKFKLQCELHANRQFALERQVVLLFMRTIHTHIGTLSVDLKLEEDDFYLCSIFEYLFSMYRMLYQR